MAADDPSSRTKSDCRKPCSLHSQEENQKLREMMTALSAGQGFDAQTFENLGKKPGTPVPERPVHQERLRYGSQLATLRQREIAEAEAALKEPSLSE